MCSTTPAYLGQRSRLLQLPQEIRDLIFEHLLVRDVISIECAVVSIPTRYTPSRVHSLCEEIYKMYPLRRTRTHRRIWSIPAFDIDLAFSGRDSMNSPETVHMTYQLAESKTSSPTCEVQIGLLQVCKQIYSEAKDIFYSKNIFSFTADYRIPTAFAFFCDRPAASLLLIRSLQLALTEDNNMRGTTEAHFPITRRSTDSLVLQYAYQHFTNLCNLLSTPRMQLRTLHLIVDTLDSRKDIAPGSVQQCLIWEEQKTNTLRPWIAAWIDPLLKVGELDSIMIHWIFDRPRLRRMSDTVIALRQHMLTCKQSKTRHRKDSLIDARFSFQMQHRQNEGREGEAFAQNTLNEQVYPWSYHFLDCHGFQTAREADDLFTFQERTIAQHQHVQDILAASKGLYICYCELHNV